MWNGNFIIDVTLDPRRFRTSLLTAASTFFFKHLVSYYTGEFFRQQQAPSGKKWHERSNAAHTSTQAALPMTYPCQRHIKWEQMRPWSHTLSLRSIQLLWMEYCMYFQILKGNLPIFCLASASLFCTSSHAFRHFRIFQLKKCLHSISLYFCLDGHLLLIKSRASVPGLFTTRCIHLVPHAQISDIPCARLIQLFRKFQ